jgi:predicted lipoprotein with Yx(FWY)xxD motif
MRSLVVALSVSAILLTGCGGGGPTTAQPGGQGSSPAEITPSQPTTRPPTSAPATKNVRGTVVRIAGSQFGKILFDGSGQAIYLFDKEKTTTSECYDACAEAWPPVLTNGTPVAAAGAGSDLLSTTKRTDGTIQVTYGGHPLYYYAHESKNEVRCHNVRGFGGLWLALTASGKAAAH